MKYQDLIQQVADLETELFILAAKRSIRPNVKDQARMKEIFAELYALTNDEKYKI